MDYGDYYWGLYRDYYRDLIYESFYFGVIGPGFLIRSSWGVSVL